MTTKAEFLDSEPRLLQATFSEDKTVAYSVEFSWRLDQDLKIEVIDSDLFDNDMLLDITSQSQSPLLTRSTFFLRQVPVSLFLVLGREGIKVSERGLPMPDEEAQASAHVKLRLQVSINGRVFEKLPQIIQKARDL